MWECWRYLVAVLFGISLIISDIEHLSCAYWPFVCLLWRNVYLDIFSLFWLGCFFLLLSGMRCLHTLEIKLFLVASFANIFSQPVNCFLLMVSFAVKKLTSLIRSHLFIFAFISIALWDEPKKHWYDLCQNVLPVFSSSSIMVSGLIFKSLIHLKYFCAGYEEVF